MVDSQPSDLRPQPSYLNPQPSYLSPQPSYLSPQPSYLSPQPSCMGYFKNSPLTLASKGVFSYLCGVKTPKNSKL